MKSDVMFRVGKFKMNRRLFYSSSFEEMQMFMSNFIIVRAEFFFVEDVFEYIAISPLFEKIKESEIIPEYEIKIDSLKKKVTAKRIK